MFPSLIVSIGYAITYCLLSRTPIHLSFTCAFDACAALPRELLPRHIDRSVSAHSALRYRKEQSSCCRPVLLIDVRSTR